MNMDKWESWGRSQVLKFRMRIPEQSNPRGYASIVENKGFRPDYTLLAMSIS
jgi:hypothetical protein